MSISKSTSINSIKGVVVALYASMLQTAEGAKTFFSFTAQSSDGRLQSIYVSPSLVTTGPDGKHSVRFPIDGATIAVGAGKGTLTIKHGGKRSETSVFSLFGKPNRRGKSSIRLTSPTEASYFFKKSMSETGALGSGDLVLVMTKASYVDYTVERTPGTDSQFPRICSYRAELSGEVACVGSSD